MTCPAVSSLLSDLPVEAFSASSVHVYDPDKYGPALARLDGRWWSTEDNDVNQWIQVRKIYYELNCCPYGVETSDQYQKTTLAVHLP